MRMRGPLAWWLRRRGWRWFPMYHGGEWRKVDPVSGQIVRR